MWNFIKKAPLAFVLLLGVLVFTIVAAVGRTTAYAQYDHDLKKEPELSLVFKGLHDGVTPAGALLRRQHTSASSKDVEAILGRQNTEEPAAAATEQEVASAAREESQEGVTQETEAAAKTQDDTANAAADLTIPDGVNNPVVQAEDYGNMDKRFLAPEGTVFPTQTEGIFAPDGTYYKLQQVDDSYFADALFIGDSRTDGLYTYGNMNGKTTFFAKDALSVFKIFDLEVPFHTPDAQTTSEKLLDVLGAKQYRKIYICIGVNELGMPTTVEYYNKYKELLEVVRKLQPDSIIYIEGMMHVTEKYAKSSSVFNNTNIVERNTAVSTLANGRDIFYIDMNSAVCDENGNVRPELSNDGVHLTASSYELWHQFLLQNAIVRNKEDWKSAEDAQEGEQNAGNGIQDGAAGPSA